MKLNQLIIKHFSLSPLRHDRLVDGKSGKYVLSNHLSICVQTQTRRASSKAHLRPCLFESLDSQFLSKSSVLLFIRNKLSSFKTNESYYNSLLKDERLTEYFKRYYPFAKLSAIEKYIKRSKYYDVKYFEKLASQVSQTRDKFLDNLRSATSLMSSEVHVAVSETEHFIGLSYIHERVFRGVSTDFRPSLDCVLEQIKWDASSGIPKPWIRKGQLRSYISSIVQSIIDGSFEFNKVTLSPVTAAFVRNQITKEGLKVRLVFAVNYVFLAVETYFNAIIKNITDNVDSRAIHGYTQIEISELVQKGKRSHTLSIDYSRFDQRMPTFVLASVLLYLVALLNFNPYLQSLFVLSYSYFMTMPVFHPSIPYIPKERGLSSGSGYTSIIGSLCNAYMLSIAVHRYCKQNNLKYNLDRFDIYVSSDDTLIMSDFYINHKKLNDILLSAFSMETELESYAKPGVDVAYFLGSKWIDGAPLRDVNRMLGRILYGNPNLPKMSAIQLIQSRSYEILGNTIQYSEIYGSFKVPYPSGLIYRILELSDYSQRRQLEKKLTRYEKRAIPEMVYLNSSSANQVWKSR